MPSITEDWLKDKMEEVMGEPVVVDNLENEKDPKGLLSKVFTATVTLQKTRQTLELFIKAAPESQDMVEFVTDQNLDKLELQFYREIVPDLAAFEKKVSGRSVVEKIIPTFIAGNSGDFYLIMENLCSRQFEVKDCNSGIEVENMKTLVQTLASFHAATMAMERDRVEKEKNWSWRSQYSHLSTFLDTLADNPMVATLVQDTLEMLDKKYSEYKGSEIEAWLTHYSKASTSYYYISFCYTWTKLKLQLGLISCKSIWVISLSHSKNMLVLVKIAILQSLSFFILE